MSGLRNTSNPHVGLSPRPKHFTLKVLFLVIAVPIAALVLWFGTRPGTMKRAAELGHSVSSPSSLLPATSKPKPAPGKLLEQPTAPAPRPPAPEIPRPQTAYNAPPSPVQTVPGPATTAVAPAFTPGPAQPAPAPAARPAYAPLSYNARHDKVFGGSCSGQLILSSSGLQFNCPDDSHGSLQVALSEISSVDENGVRLASGKKLHFSINGMTKPGEQALFADWLRRLR